MDLREGSSQVEAAFVFPLIVLIVAAFISAGAEIYSRVRGIADTHYESAAQAAEGKGIDAEDIIRARRYLQ